MKLRKYIFTILVLSPLVSFALPDVFFENIEIVNASPKVGSCNIVRFTVKNKGDVRSTSTGMVHLTATNLRTGDSGARRVHGPQQLIVNPGESEQYTIMNVDIPSSGTIHLQGNLNANSDFRESDMSNNLTPAGSFPVNVRENCSGIPNPGIRSGTMKKPSLNIKPRQKFPPKEYSVKKPIPKSLSTK